MQEYYRDCRKFEKLPYHEQVETLNSFIVQDRTHWQDIHDNGCHDPFWPDGTNMNLVRNHIIHWVLELRKLDRSERQLSMFDLLGAGSCQTVDLDSDERIPPEVSNDYMAKERVCHYFDIHR